MLKYIINPGDVWAFWESNKEGLSGYEYAIAFDTRMSAIIALTTDEDEGFPVIVTAFRDGGTDEEVVHSQAECISVIEDIADYLYDPEDDDDEGITDPFCITDIDMEEEIRSREDELEKCFLDLMETVFEANPDGVFEDPSTLEKFKEQSLAWLSAHADYPIRRPRITKEGIFEEYPYDMEGEM